MGHSQQSGHIRHGGAIDLAARDYGIPASEWLDLSTGINPCPYRVPDIVPHHWHRLPLTSELDALAMVAARYYRVADPRQIVCAPGTQSLIQTIPFWLRDRENIADVHILGHTYGEHAKGWQRARFHTVTHETSPENRYDTARNLLTSNRNTIVVFVNPNNPDGGRVPVEDIVRLSEIATRNASWLLVDEAFMDCTPDQSVCPVMDRLTNTIVLRSFGKFFGLAGMRLGFAVMNGEPAESLRDRMGPWAIPGPTINIAQTAFEDGDWQDRTRTRLTADAARLDALIAATTDLVPVGGPSLFRSYSGRPQDIKALAEHLARHAILIRCFDENARLVRFGLPGTSGDWRMLEAAITQYRG